MNINRIITNLQVFKNICMDDYRELTGLAKTEMGLRIDDIEEDIRDLSEYKDSCMLGDSDKERIMGSVYEDMYEKGGY